MAELSKRLEAITTERDAALQQLSGEKAELAKAHTQEQARWRERETALVRAAEEAGRQAADLAAKVTAAQRALQDRDKQYQQLEAGSGARVAELSKRLEGVTAERDAALRRVQELQADVKPATERTADVARKLDESNRARAKAKEQVRKTISTSLAGRRQPVAPYSATGEGPDRCVKIASGRTPTCPACRSGSVCRVYRKSWMRLLVVSRRYACDDCGCGFVTLFGFIKWRLP